MLHLLCETSTPASLDFPLWGNLSLAGVALGILGYVLKYTLPKIVSDFRDEIKLQREAHSQQTAQQQKLFSDELARERDLSQRREATWRETLLNLMHGYARQSTQPSSEADAGRQTGPRA